MDKKRLISRVRNARSTLGNMEPFVRWIVSGGVALVIGLWGVWLAPAWTSVWLLGIAFAAFGIFGLGYGIWSELEY